jgi:hypothetical protein
MSDHQTSYTVNSMIGRLFLKNEAFQSLSFQGQQSIVIDLIQESRNSDVNMGEILSNECFSDYQDTDEKRSVAAIFKICSYCGKVKEDVQDYDGGHSVQGFCADCAKELEISEMSS